MTTAILDDIVAEAERVLGLASNAGVPLRLLGGVAVRLRAREVPAALDRAYQDLDFAVTKKGASGADQILRDAGYQPNVSFNAMNSSERGLYLDEGHGRQVDLFVHLFRMCHEITLGDRLEIDQSTVPLAELLLTKLQIIEVNEKDIRDTVLLLHGHEVADHDEDAVNGARIAALCASDWGLWRTITANLERCRGHVEDYRLADEERALVVARLDALLERIDAEPKSRRWKLRAKLGERKRWYELPEEV